MSTYKEIKGFKVQTLSTDTVASQIDTGAWASAASMNTARIASTGTGSASSNYIIAGGYYLPPSADRSATEQYNGTSWTEVADCPQDLTYGNGLGSGTSSLLASYSQPGPVPGGYGPTTATHKWNGSSWSTVNSMNTFRQNAGTAGSTTAGLIFGGTAPGANANTESWDGTNWTEVADLNTAKSDIGGGCGVQTAALSASGSPVTTEQWDGSSWTEVTEINTPRQNSGKAGLYTSALCISGQNPSTYLANVEVWNGSSWTEVSDVSTARGYVGGMSPTGSAGSSDAIIAGGSGASLSAATEVWTTSSTFTKTNLGQVYFNSGSNAFKVTEQPVPGGTWASGGSMNTQGYAVYSLGTQTAAMRVGGYGGPPVGYQGNAETYNGSSWTAIPSLQANRSNEGGAGSGTITAALIYGGTAPPGRTGNTEEYDGSSWAEQNNLNTTRNQLAGVGTQTATLAFAGQSGPGPSGYSATVEFYNGSSWTETTDVNTARGGVVGIGQVYTAALAATGYGPGPSPALVEDWNGTAWTEVTEVNTGRGNVGSRGGTSTNGIIASGYSGSTRTVNCEHWNGSSWTEIANVAVARYGVGGQGSSTATIAFGGNSASSDPAGVTTTEEFTAPEVNKTITVS